MIADSSGWIRALDLADQAIERIAALGCSAPGTAEEILSRRSLFSDPSRRQQVSMGGHCRLLETGDGWCAVHLPREDDLNLLPAWIGVVTEDGKVPWSLIAEGLRSRSSDDVVGAGQELGLAVASLPVGNDEQLDERGMSTTARPWLRRRIGEPSSRRAVSEARVVDLSALWAGPLCARVLSDAGARVSKVESLTRPDASRIGDPGLFEWLHRDHEMRVIDFDAHAGREELIDLIDRADVVIEGSRPRAMDRLGIDPEEMVAKRAGKVWLSITAYGRCGPWRDRVGFGDDAAVAGGLVDRDADGVPSFVGDAVADPLTGLVAAALVIDAVARGGGVMLDVALREVARCAAHGSSVVW